MVNEKYHLNKRIGIDVHRLWCLDHRLNLVAQVFREVPNINFDIRFVKWITAGDRLVSYTACARLRSTGTKKKKIPPPSETMWLFFRDALRALLRQTELVDAFLNNGNNREKWETHISTSKNPIGQIKDFPFSFRNPLIVAHFKFASFLFDVLGDINEISKQSTVLWIVSGDILRFCKLFGARIDEIGKQRLESF